MKTYSITDNDGKYIGYRITNSEALNKNTIEAKPPELTESQEAYWLIEQQAWHIVKDDTAYIFAKEKSINAIDTYADAARSRDRSIGQLLDIEYQQVIEAHGRWYAEGYDETKCPDEIKAWAGAEDVTPLQAAQEIAEAAAHREEVIRQIRSIRLAGKAAVRAAADADDADFTAIAEPFIDQLNHIGDTTIAAA